MGGIVYALVLAFALQAITGMEVKALLATSAVLTLVLGLALQETLGMLFAGLALVGDRRLAAGTWVELDGTWGQVEELGWRVLVLRTRQGQRLMIPNTTMARASVRFWPEEGEGAVVVRLGTTYGKSPEKVREVLTRIAADVVGPCVHRKPEILLKGFGDSALEWECRLWTREPWRESEFTDAFLRRAWYALRREGIEIPFPQRVVHTAEPKPVGEEGGEAVLAALAACPALALLSAPAREILARHSRVATFGDGELVVRQGEVSRALYVIVRGSATVLRDGKEVAFLAKSDLFGEIAFLTGQPRAASVRANGELTVLEVDAEALGRALAEEPNLADELARSVAERTAQLERLVELEKAADSRELATTLLSRLRQFLRR